MKISIYEVKVEADARELRESNTLSQNFTSFLSRAFQSREPFEDTKDEEERESEDENE